MNHYFPIGLFIVHSCARWFSLSRLLLKYSNNNFSQLKRQKQKQVLFILALLFFQPGPFLGMNVLKFQAMGRQFRISPIHGSDLLCTKLPVNKNALTRKANLEQNMHHRYNHRGPPTQQYFMLLCMRTWQVVMDHGLINITLPSLPCFFFCAMRNRVKYLKAVIAYSVVI